jgi:uncharacterized protein
VKESKYNFYFHLEENKYLAYNALKNGLAVISDNIVNGIKNIEFNKDNMNEEQLNELLSGGFIIDKDFDELVLLKTRLNLHNFSTNILGLTITPTLDCNLACKYCYEELQKNKMTKKVQKQLVTFVEDYLKSGVRYVEVTWYGGEPLLCFDIVESLSAKFISLCKKYNAEYSADIVTNGTLLDTTIMKKLVDLKIRGVQITLDGKKEIHDSRRFYHDGKGSFDDIISNLQEIVGILPIMLRINVDETNIQDTLSFVNNLIRYEWFDKESISIYYGYVKKFSTTCKCNESECLKPNEFWEQSLLLQNHLFENGFGFHMYPNVNVGCGATAINAFVVGPFGELYKCWSNVGLKSYQVGTIFAPIELNKVHMEYLTESFEGDEECKNCKFLPICMGGCVDIRLKIKKNEMRNKDCSGYKYYLSKALKKYYISKILNKEECNSCKSN